MFNILNKKALLQLFFAAISLNLALPGNIFAEESASGNVSDEIFEIRVPEFTPIVYARAAAAFLEPTKNPPANR